MKLLKFQHRHLQSLTPSGIGIYELVYEYTHVGNKSPILTLYQCCNYEIPLFLTWLHNQASQHLQSFPLSSLSLSLPLITQLLSVSSSKLKASARASSSLRNKQPLE